MPPAFDPTSLDNLAAVDTADCRYAGECVEIQGVVSLASQCGWPATDAYSVHCFAFAAWRRVGHPMVNRELTILRPVHPAQDKYSAFPACSLHQIRVLLSEAHTRAIYSSGSETDIEDTDLLAVANELKKPVTIRTARFGTLLLDRETGRFEGDVEWNGQPIRLTITADETNDIAGRLKTAEALWDAADVWKRRVDDFAVQELLPLKNEDWLDEGETPLTPDQFQERMSLESIAVSPDGAFEFWHDDGDLFYGHFIQVSGSLEAGLTSADIPG